MTADLLAAPSALNANNSAPSFALQSPIVAGDLICVAVCFDGQQFTSFDGIGASTTGWVNKGSFSQAACELEIWMKVAVGDEDGQNVDFTLGGTEQATALVFLVDAASWSGDIDDVFISTGVSVTTNGQPNSDSISPTPGSDDYLVLSIAGWDGPHALTTYPENYNLLTSGFNRHAVSTAGTGGGSGIGMGVRALTFSTEDPGAFAIATAAKYNAITLAIAPAAGGLSGDVGLVTDTSTAQPIGRAKTRALGLVTDTSTAQPIGRAKTRAVGLVPDTSTAQPIGRAKTRAVGLPVDTSTAQPITEDSGTPVGLVVDTSTAQPIGRAKTRAVGLVVDTSTAQPITVATGTPVGLVTDTSTAQPIAASKTRAVGLVVDTSTAQPITAAIGQAVGLVTDTSTAQPLAASKTRAVGLVVDTSTALTITASVPTAFIPENRAVFVPARNRIVKLAARNRSKIL